jgi:hypothetical protein
VGWEKDVALCSTYLAFAVCPEVGAHANNVIQSGIRALIYQERDESAQRVDDETCFNRPVQAGAREETQGPLPAQPDNAQDDVEDLESGDLGHSAVEVLGEEVPEDLGPEDGFNAGAYLVCVHVSIPSEVGLDRILGLTSSSGQYNEACPVVLD